MTRKVPIDQTIADAEQIVRVWEENQDFTLGEITLPKLKQKLTDLRAARGRVETLRTQLTAATNDSNEMGVDLANVNTRARSGLRAVYGPNSTQYEQGGGTRTDERKRPTRKGKAGQDVKA
jgi:hypothetical protein